MSLHALILFRRSVSKRKLEQPLATVAKKYKVIAIIKIAIAMMIKSIINTIVDKLSLYFILLIIHRIIDVITHGKLLKKLITAFLGKIAERIKVIKSLATNRQSAMIDKLDFDCFFGS